MRAWIVGNGESLKDTPLHTIREDGFACNRIHKIYPVTTWRPTYYVRVEPTFLLGSSQEFFAECRVHIEAGEQCIFPSEWKETLGDHPNIEWINTCHHYKYEHTHKKFPGEWHLPFLCDVNAVTTMMQIAVLKGYSEIILVGCDLVGNHFSPDDHGAVETQRLQRVHEIAAKSCPVPVFNATVGGALEAYPRVDVMSLC